MLYINVLSSHSQNEIFIRAGKPSLVRETSRFSVLETIKHPVLTAKKFKSPSGDSLSGVILAPSLEERLR